VPVRFREKGIRWRRAHLRALAGGRQYKKAQQRRLWLICTDDFCYRAPVQRKRLCKPIIIGGFLKKTASENQAFPLVIQ
jgi:hypothetical protein